MAHQPISPAILYWGTPVVLVTTTNPDGTSNIAPMSSAFWLANRCMLGLAKFSQTTENLLRTGECVLNLASDDMTHAVNALAKTTGMKDVPPPKIAMGYRYEKDKFAAAGLTPVDSVNVAPARIAECPVQMECKMVGYRALMEDLDNEMQKFVFAFEVVVLQTYAADYIRMAGHANRIDPDRWRPMIMSFQKLYGLAGEPPASSRLAEIDEEMYRMPGPDESIKAAGGPSAQDGAHN